MFKSSEHINEKRDGPYGECILTCTMVFRFSHPSEALPGDLGIWGEGPFIFMKLGRKQ